jgi:feruloyl esterase
MGKGKRIALLLGTALFVALPVSSAHAQAQPDCFKVAGLSIDAARIGLPTHGATVTSVVLVKGKGDGPTAIGDYCLVSGEVAPVDPAAPKIKFQIALPRQWNGKALMMGGGGFDGVIPKVDGNLQNTTPDMPTPLARGYAVFGSDSGHQARSSDPAGKSPYPSGDFFANDESFANYIGDALKKTRDSAMLVISAAYGKEPTKSYFLGGSKGGHEALEVARRWPKDWDGIVAFYPSQNFTVAMLGALVLTQAFDTPGTFPSLAKRRVLYRAALQACDARDGAADRVISDIRGCRRIFKLETARVDGKPLRCPDGKDAGDDCLSDAQIGAFRRAEAASPAGVSFADGQTRFNGYNVLTAGLGASSELPLEQSVAGATLGTTLPTFPPSDGNASGYVATDIYLREGVARDSKFNSLAFDLAGKGPVMDRLAKLSMVDKSGGDMTAFAARGGKLLVMHGTDDMRISPRDTEQWYDALRARMGAKQVDRFLRFYEIPGFGHSTSTVFRVSWDQLTALENWVERGQDPASNQIVTDIVGVPGRTRPACLYPAWPKYKGAGDVNLASSFSCSTR